jgi:HEAT repeat protein
MIAQEHNLASDTASEALLYWLNLITVGVLLAVVATFVSLFWLRLKHQKVAEQVAQRQTYWQQVLFEACDPKHRIKLDSQRLRELKANKNIFFWFMQKWSQMHQYVRGDADDGLQQLADRLKLETRILRLTDTQDTRLLIACCIALGDMQKLSSHAVIRLVELTDHKSGMVVLTALRALMRYDAPLALPLLLKNVQHIAPERLVSILRECPPKLLSEQVSQTILRDNPKYASYLLKVIKGMDLNVSDTFVMQTLQRFADSDDIIAATIGLIQSPKLLPLVRQHTKHPAEAVRIQATSTLARLAQPADIELLWQLVCDKSWWVRYRAAEGLFEQPQLARSEIMARAAQLTDEYGKTMIAQIAAETHYGRI